MGEQEKKELPKHVHKSVTTGKPVEKSKLQKAAALFFAEDLDNIKGSIVDDYIRPRSKEYAKDAVRKFRKFIFDTFVGAAETIFFGKAQGPEKRGYYNGQSVNYYSYYDGGYSSNSGGSSSNNVKRSPISHLKVIEIVGGPDEDGVERDAFYHANRVVGEMVAIGKRYPAVSVADYYQLVNVVPTEMDFDWGWQGFIGADLIESKNGYIIDLPKPVPLK